MAKQKMVPAVRFKGFSEDWKQKKLGEVLSERKVLQKISEDAPILAFAAGQGVIDRSERKSNNRDHLTHDQANKIYKVTEIDDIVYNPSNLKYGAIDRNKHGRGVISPIYVTFITDENSSFIEPIVKSEKFKLKALQYEEGTVVKRQSVKPENLLSLDICITSSRLEQSQIGVYFQNLDQMLALHQHKHEKLLTLKKAMLKKMFPASGANTPEIRFKGFSEPWEETQLREICTYHKSSLSVGDALSDGEYELYDANEVIGFTNENVQPCDYITIIKDGAGVGRVRMLHKNTSFIGTMGAFHAKDTNIYFLLCALEKTDFTTHTIGSTIPHIYFSHYGDDLHFVPKLEEQQKIGTYFRQLGELITQHGTQVEKLMQLKAACLEKMFV